MTISDQMDGYGVATDGVWGNLRCGLYLSAKVLA